MMNSSKVLVWCLLFGMVNATDRGGTLLSDYCSTNSPSSCLQCSCEDSCIEENNCCPDYNLKLHSQSSVCKPAAYNPTKSQYFYLIHDRCPQGFTDNLLKAKCRGENLKTLKELNIVSSTSTMKIYQNVYCALCNEDSDIVLWNLIPGSCVDEYLADRLISDLINSTCGSRPISYSPPSEIKVDALSQECACMYNDKPSCPYTGWWGSTTDSPNETSTTVYVDTMRLHMELKSHVYCQMCNPHPSFEQSEVCSYKRGRTLTSLTNVLNFDIYPEHSNENTCKEDEVYDAPQKICRTVHCPILETYTQGGCVPLNKPPTPLVVAAFPIRLPAMYFSAPGAVVADIEAMTTQLQTHVSDWIDSTDTACTSCSTRVYLEMEPMERTILRYVVFMAFKLKPYYCTQYRLVNALNGLNQPVNVSVKLNGKDFYLPLQVQYSEYYDTVYGTTQNSANFTVLSVGIRSCKEEYFLPNTYQLSELKLCSYVILSRKAYVYAFGDKTLTNDDFDNDSVRVCWLDYLRRSGLQAKQLGNQPAGIVTFICTCISLLCTLITLATFVLVKSLRRFPGSMVIVLSTNLFSAQLFFTIAPALAGTGWTCQLAGILVHFFWLADLFSMNAYMFLIYKVIREGRLSPGESYPTSFKLSLFYIYVSSCVFVGINIGYSSYNSVNWTLGYGSKICFIDTSLMRISVFAAPIALLTLSNVFLFALTIFLIKKVEELTNFTKINRNYQGVFLRLSILTGISWFLGFISEFLNDPISEYCFIILTAGQGALLMVSFVFRRAIIVKCKRTIFHSDTGLSRTGQTVSATSGK